MCNFPVRAELGKLGAFCAQAGQVGAIRAPAPRRAIRVQFRARAPHGSTGCNLALARPRTGNLGAILRQRAQQAYWCNLARATNGCRFALARPNGQFECKSRLRDQTSKLCSILRSRVLSGNPRSRTRLGYLSAISRSALTGSSSANRARAPKGAIRAQLCARAPGRANWVQSRARAPNESSDAPARSARLEEFPELFLRSADEARPESQSQCKCAPLQVRAPGIDFWGQLCDLRRGAPRLAVWAQSRAPGRPRAQNCNLFYSAVLGRGAPRYAI